jgi:hypothetical protein
VEGVIALRGMLPDVMADDADLADAPLAQLVNMPLAITQRAVEAVQAEDRGESDVDARHAKAVLDDFDTVLEAFATA